MTDQAVPEKYQAEPRKWEQKDWLYEQYWGEEMRSIAEIAEECGLHRKTVTKQFRQHGIPIREDCNQLRRDYDPIEARRPDEDDDRREWTEVADDVA